MKKSKFNVAVWQLQNAKTQFSQVVDAAMLGVPQVVTRHGKEAVVVIAMSEYEDYQAKKSVREPTLLEHLLKPLPGQFDGPNIFDDDNWLNRKPGNRKVNREIDFGEP